ncbi:hypothetical protein BBC27_06630 [Acidithiobacillus ferrivorans]|uniref:Uncharacterized protein n=1 Tax=Acidithiobacillus ferrivorans TaxID=160808 RepID=A0A1B9C183_9PROT|nr:hypothetical protein BBC27_06630 [Acidithiobacillus ferrivorans]
MIIGVFLPILEFVGQEANGSGEGIPKIWGASSGQSYQDTMAESFLSGARVGIPHAKSGTNGHGHLR